MNANLHTEMGTKQEREAERKIVLLEKLAELIEKDIERNACFGKEREEVSSL